MWFLSRCEWRMCFLGLCSESQRRNCSHGESFVWRLWLHELGEETSSSTLGFSSRRAGFWKRRWSTRDSEELLQDTPKHDSNMGRRLQRIWTYWMINGVRGPWWICAYWPLNCFHCLYVCSTCSHFHHTVAMLMVCHVSIAGTITLQTRGDFFEFTLKVLALQRRASLNRLLESISRPHNDNHHVSLEFHSCSHYLFFSICCLSRLRSDSNYFSSFGSIQVV